MNLVKKLTRHAGRAALPFLAACSIYAAVACGGKAAPTLFPTAYPTPPTSAPAATYTVAQRNALDAMKRHFMRYYNAVNQFYQGVSGPVDYRQDLSPMLEEVNSILPQLALDTKDIDGSIEKLSRYFESYSIVIVPDKFKINGEEVKSVLIAGIIGRENRVIDGQTTEIVEYGNIRVPEILEIIQKEDSTAAFSYQGRVYIDGDRLSRQVEDSWKTYEKSREVFKEHKRKGTTPEVEIRGPTEQNLVDFRRDLEHSLRYAENIDDYLARMDSKADFVKTIKGAKREIMTAHEVEHLKNAGRLPPAKDETSAKFAEFRALKVLPEDHTGLDILGDTIGWLDHPLREYREAAESILGCFVNRMISPQWEFPELRLHEIDTQDRLAADKIAARFLKLKKVQIISLAEHCERELRFEDEADSMGYSHNSTKEVWRRNEARFAMDAQSRMKAYLRRSYSMFT